MSGYFEVRPRFTCGSPGLVDLATAQHILQQERDAYKAYLEGAFGEDAKQWAERIGLEWIAFAAEEKGRFFYKRDLNTGNLLSIPLKDSLNLIPVYQSDLPDAAQVVTNLRNMGVKFKTWTELSADKTTSRTWFVVPQSDLEKSERLIGWLEQKPIPQYFGSNKR